MKSLVVVFLLHGGPAAGTVWAVAHLGVEPPACDIYSLQNWNEYRSQSRMTKRRRTAFPLTSFKLGAPFHSTRCLILSPTIVGQSLSLKPGRLFSLPSLSSDQGSVRQQLMLLSETIARRVYLIHDPAMRDVDVQY